MHCEILPHIVQGCVHCTVLFQKQDGGRVSADGAEHMRVRPREDTAVPPCISTCAPLRVAATSLCRLLAKVGNFEFVPYQRYTGSTIGKIILPVRPPINPVCQNKTEI